MKFHDNVELPYDAHVEQHLDSLPDSRWRKLKERFPGVSMRIMFNSVKPDRIRQLVDMAVRRDQTYRPPKFLSYFVVDFPAAVNVEQLVGALLSWSLVQTAYFDPPGEDPAPRGDDPRLTGQGYLDAAPSGIDAKFAWKQSGGHGEGQQLIDLEQGWTLNHEELVAHGATVLFGDVIDKSRPHGTSVLGVICAAANKVGGLGIAPDIDAVDVVSHSGELNTVPNAMLAAIDNLEAGGVLLLEVQRDWLPTETLQADFDTIRLATALKITVIEAAGNGLNAPNDLDAFTDTTGNRILNRANAAFRDSGAIMVGAAASNDLHPRWYWSNFGSRIDCFAWGENVDTATSTKSAPYSTKAYTKTFQGTSSAAAIIAGAALQVQGIAQASLGHRLSPLQMRAVLSNPATGTASSNPAADRVGVMPDFLKIITSGAIAAV